MCFITILAAFSTCRCANRSTGGNQSVSSWRTTNGRNNMLNTYYSKHAVKTFHIKFHCINIHCVKQGYEEQQKLISVSWNQTSEQQKWSSDGEAMSADSCQLTITAHGYWSNSVLAESVWKRWVFYLFSRVQMEHNWSWHRTTVP